MRRVLLVSLFLTAGRAFFSQFLLDNFDNFTGNWQSAVVFGNSPNILSVTQSLYSIENNSLEVGYNDVNNPWQNTPGYTYGNSEESALHYRFFSTTNQYNIKLKFDWKCNGESGRDYGSAYYSTDGMNWQLLKKYQSGKGNEIQNEVINLPKCADNTGFYLGFTFTADNSFNFQPGLVIDNIELYGNYCTSSNKPNAPYNPGNLIACYNDRDNVGLTAMSAVGNLRWYSDAGGCADYLHEGNVFNTLPTGNKTFYAASFNSGNGCESSNRIPVTLTTLPLPTIYTDTVIDATLGGDGAIQISVSGTGPFYYYWSLNNAPNFAETTQDILNLEEGNYEVFVTDGNGCKDSLRIVVLSKAELNIPGGISPNGDGYNDVWKISGMDQWTDYSVELRNMRGELVYKQDATDNPTYIPFDGTNQNGEKLSPGDYSYFVRSKIRKKRYSGILSIKYD